MKLKRKFAQKLRASIELNQMRKCVKRAWSVPFFNALTMSRFADFATEDYEGEILKMGDNVNIHPVSIE